VLIHGFLSSAICFYPILKSLSEKYRIVMFDVMSWGLNTRLDECSGMESVEAAEAWMLEWLEKVMAKLDLPDKFLLSGHSFGGWLSSLYASHHPEKIEAMFLQSPAGMMPYDPDTYDPYTFLDMNDLRRVVPKAECIKQLKRVEDKVHPISDAHGVPQCLVKMEMRRRYKETMCNHNPGKYSDEDINLVTEYFVTMMQNHCDVDTVCLIPQKWYGVGINDMSAENRLGNPACDFPIAAAFADRDILGTEGMDKIVRNNKHFENGQSQLFKIDNASHNIQFSAPDELSRVMIGFFNGTIRGNFDIKTRWDVTWPTRK